MDLQALLSHATNRVTRRVFEHAGLAFEVELRCLTRRDLLDMRRLALRREKRAGANGGTEWIERYDTEKLQSYLAESCITGWSGLTLVKALSYANKAVAGVDPTAEVPFNVPAARAMLADAFGFDDWVWEQVSQIAADQDIEEATEKKTSASTSTASTAG